VNGVVATEVSAVAWDMMVLGLLGDRRLISNSFLVEGKSARGIVVIQDG
jgi:hypothetical protein